MRLKPLVVTLEPPLAAALEALIAAGVHDGRTLVFGRTTQDLSQYATVQDIEALRTLVARAEAPVMVSAAALLDDAPHLLKPLRVATSSPSLVDIVGTLNQRLSPSITEIFGAPSSGKTLVALHQALHHLLQEPQASVLWIDTEGTFDVARAHGVLDVLLAAGQPANSSVLDRLEIRHAFDLESFVRLLAEASTASLIVIDNLGSLYPDSNTQSRAQLANHLAILRSLSARSIIATCTSLSGPSRLSYSSSSSSISTTTPLPSSDLSLHLQTRPSPAQPSGGSASGVFIAQVVHHRFSAMGGTFFAFWTNGLSMVEISPSA